MIRFYITVVKEVYPYTFGEHIFVFQVQAMQRHLNCHSRGVTFFSMYCYCSMKTMSTITSKLQCQAMVKFCDNLRKENKTSDKVFLFDFLVCKRLDDYKNTKNAATSYSC